MVDGVPPPEDIQLTNLIQQDSESLNSSSASPQSSVHEISIPNHTEPPLVPPPRTNTCIYRVPRMLRQVNQEAYTPHLVSIGPIHRGHENFTAMERQKQHYLDELCATSQKQRGELRREVQNREEEIRSFYEEYSFDELNSEKFTEMVLLDSAFIIMIMRTKWWLQQRGQEVGVILSQQSGQAGGASDPTLSQQSGLDGAINPPITQQCEQERASCPCLSRKKGRQERATKPPSSPPDDYVLSKTWRVIGVARDLMLLENQLPYFVLHHLYTFAFGNSPPTLYDVAWKYFQHFAVRPEPDERRVCSCSCCCSCVCYLGQARHIEHNFEQVKEIFRNKGFHHFTDMIRTLWSHKHQEKNDQLYFTYVSNVYNIADLDDACVKFKMEPEAWPLKIEFVKLNPIRRVLKMPRVTFDDNSECLIRNLMAYEQCHDPYDAYISEFFVFLSCLINSDKDVELLAREGIINNMPGASRAVASVVKNLGEQIVLAGNRYLPLYLEMNAHCDKWFINRIATLRRVYFSELGKGTGTIVIVVMLVLALIQTIKSFNQNTTVILRHN